MTDERLENMLSKSMPQIGPGPELNRRILAEMDGRKKRRFHGKRAVVLAVACILMLSSITVGAATIYYYSVTRTTDLHTKDYRKIDYAEEKLGCDIKFVKELAGEYSFEQMDILNDTLYAVEESGEVAFTEENASVVIWYSGNGGELMLICSKDDREAVETNDSNVRDIAGVKVRYEEVIMNKEEISAFISSVDGWEVEEYLMPGEIAHNSANWIQDGVHYFLGAMPDSATEEELLSMAQELILSE